MTTLDPTGAQVARPKPRPRLSRSLQAKLERFAAGESHEEERSEVKKLLLEQPGLVPVLVTILRSLDPKR